MRVTIDSPQALALLIQAARKSQRIRLDDLAGSAGVGPVFAREVERGKETVQLGRVLRLLSELGIQLTADVPDETKPALDLLTQKGLKPLKPRRPKASSPPPSPTPLAAAGPGSTDTQPNRTVDKNAEAAGDK